MPTKLILTNYGPTEREVLVLLVDKDGAPRFDAIVSQRRLASGRSSGSAQSIMEVTLSPDQALLVLPRATGAAKG